MPQSASAQLDTLLAYSRIDAWIAIGELTKHECAAIIEELDSELAAGFMWQWRRQLRYLDPNRRMFFGFPDRYVDDVLRVLHNLTVAPYRAYWRSSKLHWLHRELMRKVIQAQFYPPQEPDQDVQQGKQ